MKKHLTAAALIAGLTGLAALAQAAAPQHTQPAHPIRHDAKSVHHNQKNLGKDARPSRPITRPCTTTAKRSIPI